MKKLILVPVLLLVASALGCASPNRGAIQASGQIEATQIAVAPELSGRVMEVFVRQGDPVQAGDPLLRLDDSLLRSQREAAQAALDSARAGVQTAQNALDTAKAQLQETLEAELVQDQSNRLHDWFVKDPKLFDQPGWYFSRGEQIQAAQLLVDEAQQAVDGAQAQLTKMTAALDEAEFAQAEQRLLAARLGYLVARNVNTRAQKSTSSKEPQGIYNSTHCGTNEGYRLPNMHLVNVIYDCVGDPQLSDSAKARYSQAQAEVTEAQDAYNDLLSSPQAQKILTARADVATAQESYNAALDLLRSMQTGDQSAAVSAAQGAVGQAQSALDQAQAAVTSAQANLNLIETQIAKLTVKAPIQGVVLVRSIEAGEVAQAASPAFVIGKLDTLKVTVYIPEDQYGKIVLGQKATLTVDSYPGESFAGSVTRIADQAEFTPQNVQTKEGRQTTVYAVELAVDNAAGQLKPGMPTDVTFASELASK